jgi:hypothetical protein
MAIAYACECGERVTVSEEQAGHGASCPACRRELVAPASGVGEPIEAPRSSTEFEVERLDQEEAIKVRRPTWKRPAVIASIATPLIIAVFFTVLAAVLETPRLDASSEASLETSLQRMTSGMSDAQKKEFRADCMDLTLPDMMKSAFQLAFLSNRPPASDGPRMFRPLQGMNAIEIHRKAEEARRARTLADDSADAQSPQPLPGVPPPVGALSHPSGSQSNDQSPPKGEPE